MNVGKYYVAGIPFDSENSLKHYGVKGMEWNKHKFGIDADDRYIKWLKNAGQNIGRFANNAAQNVAKGATAAAKTVGSAVNKGANFVGSTTNQARKWAGQQAQNAGKAIGTAAGNVGNWANQQARNVGNTVGQAAQNVSNLYTGQPNADRAEAIDRQVQQYERMGDEMYDRGMNAQGNRYHKLAENLGRVADANQAKYDNAPRQRITDAVNNVGNVVSGVAQKAADVALWPATREGVANAAQNVGNAVGQAAQNVGNWIDQNITGNSDRARAEGYQKIADDFGNEQYAQKAQNAQEQADNSLFGRIGNAADAVGNWFGDRAQDVSQAAQNVGNWVGDRVQDAGNAVSPVAQNVSNAVSGAANKAAEGTKGFINSAGQWVSGTANNVKNTTSKAASDASKGASGFINSAGKWVSNAAGNVGKVAQDAGKAVSDAAQNVGNTVGQAAEQARGGIGGLFDRVGNAVGSAANAVGDWAGQAVQDVGGAVQNAGNLIGDRAQDVGGAVSGAAQNAGNAVSGAADWARNVANNVGQTVGNFVDQNITGNSDRAKADWYGQLSDQAPGKYNTDYWSKKQYEANNRAGRTLFGTAEGLGKFAQTVGQNVGQAVGDFVDRNITGNTMRNEANRLQSVVDGYDRGEEKPNGYYYVGGRDQAVADQQLAEKMANDSLFGRIGNAAGNVGNWAGQAAQGVGQFLNDIETARLQPKIQAATQRMVDNYGQYLQDHPENPASPRHAEWAQQQQTQLIEQLRNDPELRAYYEQYIRHSAIDEKPDGVSDAFWEKFTADGGTREEYERDWR